jgi:hypothetical protein
MTARVQVTVIYPEDKNVTNVQELAERTWCAVGKQMTVDRQGEGQDLRTVVPDDREGRADGMGALPSGASIP